MPTKRLKTVSDPAPDAEHAPRQLARFERLIADLSASFVNIAPERVDAAVNGALQHITELLDVDRITFLRVMPNGSLVVAYSAAVAGVAAVRPNIEPLYPWLWDEMRAGRVVAFTDIDTLPPEAHVDKASWSRVGTKSNLTMPVACEGQWLGALALGCLRRRREWPAALVGRVRVLADVIGNAVTHQRAQLDLAAALRFERLTSRALASLISASPIDLDRVITSSLRDAGQVLSADRVTLWQRIAGEARLEKTHRWVADDMPPSPDIADAITLPWITSEIMASRAVCRTLSELPPEASADVVTLRSLGVKSIAAVPLLIGTEVVGALSFASTRDEQGSPESLIPRVQVFGEILESALVRDRSQQREAEARAEAAHAARVGTIGVVAASLAHELAQPIAAIMANTETAKDLAASSDIDVDELRATLGDILADNNRAGTLIAQLRRFLRRGEVERSLLDVSKLVVEVASLVRGEAISRNIAIEVDVKPDVRSVSGNHAQLQQVLLNLLLNAFDAVAGCDKSARRVIVRATGGADNVRVEVQDHGAGMDEATIARAFSPFFTTKPTGMGLGLSISRSIAESHGGTLSVVSMPDRGSTFALQLPAAPA